MQNNNNAEGCLTQTVSTILMLFGGFFGISFIIATLITLSELDFKAIPVLLVSTIFMGVLPFYVGWKGKKKAKEKASKFRSINLESSFLTLAHQQQGVLTKSTVALNLKLSIDEADELLRHVTAKGIAKTEIDDNGNLIYIVNDFLPK